MEEREEKLNRTLSHSNHIADKAEELCEAVDKALEEKKRKKEEKKRCKEEAKQRKKEAKKLKKHKSGGGMFSRWRSDSSVSKVGGGGGGGGGEGEGEGEAASKEEESSEDKDVNVCQPDGEESKAQLMQPDSGETYLDVVPHGDHNQHDSGIVVEHTDDDDNATLVFRGHTSATHATEATALLGSSPAEQDVGGCCTVM